MAGKDAGEDVPLLLNAWAEGSAQAAAAAAAPPPPPSAAPPDALAVQAGGDRMTAAHPGASLQVSVRQLLGDD